MLNNRGHYDRLFIFINYLQDGILHEENYEAKNGVHRLIFHKDQSVIPT